MTGTPKSRTENLPPEVEAKFQERCRAQRLRSMRQGAWINVIVYNFFLVADVVLVPGTFWLSAFLHICVVTPLMLASAFLYGRWSHVWLNHLLAVLSPLLVVGQIMFVYALNDGPLVDNFPYLAIVVLAHSQQAQRFGRIYGAYLNLVIMVVVGVGLAFGHGSMQAKGMAFLLTVYMAWFGMRLSRWAERDQRNRFIMHWNEQQQIEAAEWSANHDPLTGLLNRRALELRFRAICAEPADFDRRLAMLMIDVDHFKAFNDHFGHLAGDKCLSAIAQTLQEQLPDDNDLCARFGGEEFIVLVQNCDQAAAASLGEQIVRAVRALGLPHVVPHAGASVTVSVGVNSGQAIGETFEQLAFEADAALYRAKTLGRDRSWPSVADINPSRAEPVSAVPRLKCKSDH